MDNKIVIDQLYLCAGECTRYYAACLNSKRKNELELSMALSLECAKDCRSTAELLEGKLENSDVFIQQCSEICERCAAECEKNFRVEGSAKCAEVCRDCSRICRTSEHAH